MNSRTFALCLLTIALGCTLVFSQVGADKRPTTAPKTSPQKTTPKQPTSRSTPRTKPQPAKPRQIGLPIEMVLLPAGTFTMGSPASEHAGYSYEGPQRPVTIREGFYMGKYEVTQSQWQQVMGTNPARFKGDNLPVETVSWNDAQEFIRKLNVMNDGYIYRLPTEAEWEYACRAGTTTKFAFGNSLSAEQANFDFRHRNDRAVKGAYPEKTTLVGSFQPNAFELYDMHGNVAEWCLDYWHESYEGAPPDGSAWLSGGDSSRRVLRGGSWNLDAFELRSAYRDRNVPYSRSSVIGFRVVASKRTQ